MAKSGFKKVILILIVLAVAVAAYAVFNLNGLVNSNKDLIVSRLEQQLGRKIEVGEIGINIWGGLGLRLTDFKIEDDPSFSDEDIVEAQKLVVSLKFIPLLKKDFQIKKIILSDPVIRLIRNTEGKYNFSTLGGKEEQEGADEKEGKQASVYISLIDISNGKVFYEDKLDKTKLNVSKIDLKSEDISLTKPVKFSLAMALMSDEQNVRLDGSAGPFGKNPDEVNIPLDLAVDIDSVDVGELRKNFPQLNEFVPAGLGLNGPLKASFTAKGDSSNLDLSGIDINGAVFGSKIQNVNIQGDIGPVGSGVKSGTTKMDLDLSLDPVEFERLKDYKPIGDSLPPELDIKGPVRASGNIKGSSDNLSLSSGLLDASDSEIVYGDLFQKAKGTKLEISTNSNITAQSLDMKNMQLELNRLIADAEGAVGLGSNKKFDLKIKSDNAELSSLSENIVSLKEYNLNGNMDVDLNLKGTSEKPQIYGITKFIDVGASPASLAKPITGINGTINFNGNSADMQKTELNLGSSKLYVDADMTSFSPLTGSYDLSSPELYLTDISKKATKHEIFRNVNITGKINADGTQTANISSSSGDVSKVKYKKLNGRATLKDGVIDFNDFKFNFLNAKFNSSGTFDLSGDVPKFQMDTNLTGVSVTDLFKTFLNPTEYPLVGISSLKLVLKGAGKGWDEISKTLIGNGKLEVKEGGIKNFNVADGVLKGVTGVPGLTNFVSDDIKEKHPAVFKNRDTKFYELSTPIDINNGKVNMNNIAIRTDGYDVSGKGVIGLDGSMDMNGVLSLSNELSDDMVEKKDLLKYLKNSDGQMEIPFTIDESMRPKPDIGHINSNLQRAATDRTKEEAKKKILETLRPKDEEEDQGEQAADPGTEQQADEEKKEEEKDPLDSLIEEGLDKVLSF